MAPLELIQVIEGARYRAMVTADAVIYGAYMIVRAWHGSKAPSFEKMLGRKTARQFKDACINGTKKEDAKLSADLKKLRAIIEAKHHGK